MFDYEVLRFIWWILVGVLLIGFVITDGFDIGVGVLLPFLGKTDTERRIMINSIAPHWDGNQVWLITAGGALFAAWPDVYAVSFSGFYFAMILVLCALFFRPIGFDYRAKVDNKTWRNVWDAGIFVSGFVPALVLGVAFGNLLQGVPFNFDSFSRAIYTGSFWGLLNPYALLAGIISLMMITAHGGTWLQMKTTNELYSRAKKATTITTAVCLIAFVLAGIWLLTSIDGYIVTSVLDHNGVSNPMNKTVSHESGAWLTNFTNMPILWVIPVLAIVFMLLVITSTKVNRGAWAFVCSSLAMACVILTAGITMFPFVMPSSVNPNVSLTLWDATSSYETLKIMTIVVAIFVPIVLLYTIWSYAKMFGRLDKTQIEEKSHSLY